MKTREVIILCEDQVHNTFVRKFLAKRGFTGRIRTLPMAGRSGGAGEKYVRKHFANELKAIRGKAAATLIVVIDADVNTVSNRVKQLNAECDQAGVPRPGTGEPVVRVIPKRNIESWFLYLMGREWDETSETWRAKGAELARPAAERLHEMCHVQQKLDQPAPPSLERACKEWARFR